MFGCQTSVLFVRVAIGGFLIGGLCSGCGQPDPAPHGPDVADQVVRTPVVDDRPALFADVTEKSRLAFRQQAGGDPYFVPRSIGSGAAFFDFDNDGRLDVYLIQNAGPGTGVKNQLFRQHDDHTFENISEGSGLDIDGFGMGVAAGDVNNDGRVDVLVTEYGGIRLFLNQTTGSEVRFTDVTDRADVDNPLWSTSASFFDYDRDGWLDLVVVNYLDYDPSRRCTDAGGRLDFCGPNSFAPIVARLFHNRGSKTESALPSFEDVTVSSGLATRPGAGLGVVCADFDGDHWQDIFIANDGVPNTLWINQKDGTFAEKGGQLGVAYNVVGEAEADMGIACGDVNADGTLDIFVTHRASETHTLWLKHASGIFFDETANSGITKTAWRGTGFGTALSDFDNDKDLDLAIVNGRVLRHAGPLPETSADLDQFWRPYAQRDQILINDGTGQYEDLSGSNPDFSRLAAVSRGLACGDFDNDGKLDLLVTSIDGPARLFRNVAQGAGHWLIVRAFDPKLRRDAYGAHLQVTVGQQILERDVNPGYSFLASNDPRSHFGLGEVERYNRLLVIWPDGVREEFGGGEADRVIQVNRGEGITSSDLAPNGTSRLKPL